MLLESLELTAFSEAASKIGPADITALEDFIQAMAKAIEGNDTTAWMVANAAFHRRVAEIREFPPPAKQEHLHRHGQAFVVLKVD